MRHRKTFFLAFTLIIGVAAMLVMPGKSQPQNVQKKIQRRGVDENRFPVADYSAVDPADPSERAKRQARGKKYDKSQWRIYPEMTSSMTRVDSVNANLPALPLSQSTAIIVGLVTDAKAYLSNDKTGVYSVFTLQVDEVLKNSSQFPLATGSSIEVERDGGRVRFPNGRTLIYSISEYDMPQVGQRYALFLTNPNAGDDFEILTGYELREGKVYPLDHLPHLYLYENDDEKHFLGELRNKTANR